MVRRLLAGLALEWREGLDLQTGSAARTVPGQSSPLQPRSSPEARDHGQNVRVGPRRDPLRSATELCSVAMTARLAAPFLVDRFWLRSTARQPDLGAWLRLSPAP